MKFSIKSRHEINEKLKNEEFDLLVIGGGITGAGILLDAATRGMKAALVEMHDFAFGTSSRSTKLVHGGLRYLKQFEVKMVAEVGRERTIVYENGPHATVPEWMLLPFHEGGTFGKFTTSLGLKLYDYLAQVKRSERRKMLTAEETIEKVPFIKKDGLKGSGIYVEYRTDDARLTIEVIKAAVENGALAQNYMKAEQFIYENGKVCGIETIDQLTGERFKIRGKAVINATGPWVDYLRNKDESKTGKVLRLTKGIHIVIDGKKFPLKQAVYFDAQDGRMIFAIPRNGKTYVGTTDTFYDLDPANPKMTVRDRDYLLQAIAYMFPGLNIVKDDVESSWAGLRPLIWEEGKNPSEISRKDEIWESDSGLLTIAGGKLTGYRKMAESIVNLAAKKLEKEHGKTFLPCRTKTFPISGGNVGGSANFSLFVKEMARKGSMAAGLTEEDAGQIAEQYGSNAEMIFQIIRDGREKAEKYGLPPLLYGKLVYAVDHEMAVAPADFFNRRTGMLLFNIHDVKKYKEKVIRFMCDENSFSEKITNKFAKELDEAIEQAQTAFPEE